MVYLVDLPSIDYKGTYYPNKNLIYWDRFHLSAASVLFYEHDDSTNYQQIAVIILDIAGLAFSLAGYPTVGLIIDIANAIIRANYRLADVAPFRSFAGKGTPGEGVIVTRMVYEVVKNRMIDENVDPDRLIFFVPNVLEDRTGSYAGYRVKFLRSFLTELGGAEEEDATLESFFENNPGKALYMMYTYERDSIASATLGSEPVPEAGLIECDSREKWGELLWSMNQPDDAGRQRYTILLKDMDDVRRLRRAVAVKRIVQLNGEYESLNIRTFRVGTMLQMPDFKSDKVNVIDADVARYFFFTEHYYQAAVKEMEHAIDALRGAIVRPEFSRYLDPVELPGLHELIEHE